MGFFNAQDFPFPSFVAYTLSVIFVCNVVIFSLLAAALASGPGAYSSFLAIPIGVGLIASIIVLLYCVHRMKYPDWDVNRTRNLVTFGALSSVSLINSLTLIVRIPASLQGSLETDFSGIPHSLAALSTVVTVSCLSTLIAFFGFYVCQNELPIVRVRDTLTCAQQVPRKPSNTVISLYRQPALDLFQGGTEMKAIPPRTTYDDWPSIPI
ncbi:hypothetical protein H2248_009782 [Termitomyces sp. 'cryptogamus']|nr:hypothetical protein H2248_009782 [Termitomyces sp. 'cryptogamus']